MTVPTLFDVPSLSPSVAILTHGPGGSRPAMHSDDPDADRLLNDHADKLRTIVAAQDRAIVPLKSIPRILLQQIIVPAGCHCGYEPWPFDVHRFGSRVYGMALPSSDLDLVCMMWPHSSGGLGPAPLSVSQSAILSIKTLLVAMLGFVGTVGLARYLTRGDVVE